MQAEAFGCDAGDACYAFATGAGSAAGIVVGTALACAWRLLALRKPPPSEEPSEAQQDNAHEVAASLCLVSAFAAFWVGTAWWPVVESLKAAGLQFDAVFLLTGLCQLPTIWRARPRPPSCSPPVLCPLPTPTPTPSTRHAHKHTYATTSPLSRPPRTSPPQFRPPSPLARPHRPHSTRAPALTPAQALAARRPRPRRPRRSPRAQPPHAPRRPPLRRGVGGRRELLCRLRLALRRKVQLGGGVARREARHARRRRRLPRRALGGHRLRCRAARPQPAAAGRYVEPDGAAPCATGVGGGRGGRGGNRARKAEGEVTWVTCGPFEWAVGVPR